MDQSKIPVRYGKALFLLGKEKGILEELYREIQMLAEFFQNTPAVAPYLKSPLIKMQTKKDLFSKHLKDALSDVTLRFIDLVISNKRERYFPDIFRNFIQFYKADAGIKTLVLTTAVEMDDAMKRMVSLSFDKKNNVRHELVTRVKPSLIGGFMLQADDMLYDASIATELKRLKKELTGQVLEKTAKKQDQSQTKKIGQNK